MKTKIFNFIGKHWFSILLLLCIFWVWDSSAEKYHKHYQFSYFESSIANLEEGVEELKDRISDNKYQVGEIEDDKSISNRVDDIKIELINLMDDFEETKRKVDRLFCTIEKQC